MKDKAKYNTNYYAVHKWLKDNYGKANKCENINCKHKNPKRYEWSLIHGKNYEKNKNNFRQLCKSCHIHYDKCYGNIGELVKGKPAHNKGVDNRINKICVVCGKKYKHYKKTSISCSKSCAGVYRWQIKKYGNFDKSKRVSR